MAWCESNGSEMIVQILYIDKTKNDSVIWPSNISA